MIDRKLTVCAARLFARCQTACRMPIIQPTLLAADDRACHGKSHREACWWAGPAPPGSDVTVLAVALPTPCHITLLRVVAHEACPPADLTVHAGDYPSLDNSMPDELLQDWRMCRFTPVWSVLRVLALLGCQARTLTVPGGSRVEFSAPSDDRDGLCEEKQIRTGFFASFLAVHVRHSIATRANPARTVRWRACPCGGRQAFLRLSTAHCPLPSVAHTVATSPQAAVRVIQLNTTNEAASQVCGVWRTCTQRRWLTSGVTGTARHSLPLRSGAALRHVRRPHRCIRD